MIKAFTGKTYTADRENLWRDFAFKGYSTIATYSGIRMVTQKTSFQAIDDWAEKLMFSALECDSDGDQIKSFSGSNPATASWAVDPDTDYHYVSPGGGIIYGKRNVRNDVPHLKFISASSRSVSCPYTAISSGTELTVYFYITPLAVDKEQYIISQEGAFSIYLDATNHVVFTISDGSDTYTLTSSSRLSANTQHRVVCQYSLSPSSIISIDIDATISQATDNTIVLAHPNNNFFIGCKDVGGTKSGYLDACIHTLAIRDGTLTVSQIATIDYSINPVGLELIDYSHDNNEGYWTGIPYGLYTIMYRFPFYRTRAYYTKDSTGKIEVSNA